jgi:signal transduction histidine kinase/CheY-like chemotaxis protein
MVSNPWHGQFLTPVIGARNEYHWAWWGVMGIGYLFLLGAVAILAVLLTRERLRADRINACVVLVAFALPAASHFVYVFSPRPLNVDPLVVGLGFACLISFLAISRTHLFSLLPFALPEMFRRDPNGLVLVDSRGRVRYANPAARRQLGEEVATQRVDIAILLRNLLSPAPNSVEDAGAWVSRLCSEAFAAPERALFRFGPERSGWLEIAAYPILSDRGTRVALSLRLEDVSEARLQHSQRLESLGVLSGGIAHDFNNILAAILGASELALLDLPEDSSARRRVKDVIQAVDRGAGLVNQLLAYAGKAPSKANPLDLSRVVEEMRQLLTVAVSKVSRFEMRLDPGLPPVKGDATQIRQLVMNLVSNAAEALEGREGCVELETGVRVVSEPELAAAVVGSDCPPGPMVYLRVRDDGVGIDESPVTRIFEPFYSTKFAGRGLGLSAVLGIVRTHEGALLIESGLEKGSTFTVLLPISQHGREVGPVVAGDADRRWRGSGCIVVADDEQMVRESLRRILESVGFSVLEAPDARETLGVLERAPDDLVLIVLDAVMPGASIEHLLPDVRRARPGAPVLVVSGFGAEMVLDTAAQDPADGFLQKPFTRDRLLDAVTKLVG